VKEKKKKVRNRPIWAEGTGRGVNQREPLVDQIVLGETYRVSALTTPGPFSVGLLRPVGHRVVAVGSSREDGPSMRTDEREPILATSKRHSD